MDHLLFHVLPDPLPPLCIDRLHHDERRKPFALVRIRLALKRGIVELTDSEI